MLVGVFVLLFFGLMFGFIAWAIIASRKQTKKAGDMRAAFTALGARFGGDQTSFAGRFGDREFNCKLSYPSRNSPPQLTLITTIDALGAGGGSSEGAGAYRDNARRRVLGKHEMLFRRETARDRLGKSLRINREFQTEDPAFDALVYLETDAPDEAVRTILSERATRDGLARLVQMGLQVKLFAPNIPLQLLCTGPTVEVIQSIERAASEVNTLVETLPIFEGEQVKAPWRTGAVIVGVFAALTTLAALPAGGLANRNYRSLADTPYALGIGFGLFAFAVLSVVAAAVLRGRSDSFRSFLFIFFTQIFALPAVGLALLLSLNGALDASRAVTHHAPIVKRWTTSGKNTTYYHVGVKSWRPGEDTISFDVSYSTYQSASVTAMDVVTKKGQFDWEWVLSYSPSGR